MTINRERAFEATDGFAVVVDSGGNLIDGPFYTGGPDSPIGLNLPENTFYVQNRSDGVMIWRKYGNDINDWAIHDGNLRHGVNADIMIVPENTTQIVSRLKIGSKLKVKGLLRCK